MVSSLRNAYNNRIQDTKPNQFILIDMCRKMSLQIIWKMLRFSSIQQWVKNENHFIFFFITYNFMDEKPPGGYFSKGNT